MVSDTLSHQRHAAYAPVAQLAEATDSKPVQCRFESDRGHHLEGLAKPGLQQNPQTCGIVQALADPSSPIVLRSGSAQA